jgi:hypothetical protein
MNQEHDLVGLMPQEFLLGFAPWFKSPYEEFC